MNTTMIALQDQTVKTFIENIKLFKSDEIIIISGNMIYSSNKLFSYLKSTEDELLEFNQLKPNIFCYEIKPLVDFVCSKNLFKLDIDIYGNLYVWINGEVKPIIIMNSVVPPIGLNIIYNMENLLISQPYLQYDNINNDEDIIKLQSSLSKDGLTMYRKDGYMMTLYKGLLPLNKSDKLNLSIYNEISENNTINFFISVFTVMKKKSKYVRVFIKYRHL